MAFGMPCDFVKSFRRNARSYRGCETRALQALGHGCFPLTPATSLRIAQPSKNCPVWLCLSLLDVLKLSQYHTKAGGSDYALANTLAAAHRQSTPHLTQLGAITVVHLKDRAMRRYLSTGLREVRYLDNSVRLFVQEHAHPPCVPGAILQSCVICSEGADPAQPLILPADPSSGRDEEQELSFSDEISVRPLKVPPICSALRCSKLLQDIGPERSASVLVN